MCPFLKLDQILKTYPISRCLFVSKADMEFISKRFELLHSHGSQFEDAAIKSAALSGQLKTANQGGRRFISGMLDYMYQHPNCNKANPPHNELINPTEAHLSSLSGFALINRETRTEPGGRPPPAGN